MSQDLMKKALSLPNGARFHRCALQVNPHHYSGSYRGVTNAGDSASYATAMIDKAVSLDVSVLAITDHNHVAGVEAFRTAAAGRGVHIFPGFELSSAEGIHVLCIYPEETTAESLGRYLGEFGVTETNPSSKLADKNFVQILTKVRERGGVTVAAHVTSQSGGLLGTLNGQARITAWRHDDLSAIQIPGAVKDLTANCLAIVENKNPDYARSHPAGENLAVAVVNAKDVAAPDDLADPGATCWIKMSEVGIEGLRQAFLDPLSRIRLNLRGSATEEEAHSELVAMTWEGGFLDGAAVHFNPNLNVLIGGRGAGKSTIIESIRAVLGREPIGQDAKAMHEGIVRHVLKSGTKVSLTVKVPRPAERHYRIERTIPNPAVVKDQSGNVSNLSPADVLPRLEVFGQHEISELARSREKLTRLLDRFVERDPAFIGRKETVRRDLETNRRALVDARAELQQIDDRLASLPGLEETLERFREAGLEERLKEKSLLVREERVLASIGERLAPVQQVLAGIRRAVPIDRGFLSAEALKELPNKDALATANSTLLRLESELQAIGARLGSAVEAAETELSGIRTTWDGRAREVQKNYESILRELQRSRVDGEEFIKLRRQIETLRPLRERQAQIRQAEREQIERRRLLLENWEGLKAEEFRSTARAAKAVSTKLRDRVAVDVTPAGDREPLLQILRTHVGGRLSEALESLRTVPDLSLTGLVDACRKGASAVAKEFKISGAQAERLASAAPEVLMRIEELDLAPTTSVKLNTAAANERPEFLDLEKLSTGQRATAVLLLLMLESDAPLIIDQPEDDLDNRFIAEGIVPRLREEKQRRQFIVSTHNANIPVLGDAELIVGLSASGEADLGRARLESGKMGSIDEREVRELVEEILEGGKDAFERRRRKYGF